MTTIRLLVCNGCDVEIEDPIVKPVGPWGAWGVEATIAPDVRTILPVLWDSEQEARNWLVTIYGARRRPRAGTSRPSRDTEPADSRQVEYHHQGERLQDGRWVQFLGCRHEDAPQAIVTAGREAGMADDDILAAAKADGRFANAEAQK